MNFAVAARVSLRSGYALSGSSLFGVGRELLGPALRDGRSPLSCGRGACGFVGNASALSTNPQVIRFPENDGDSGCRQTEVDGRVRRSEKRQAFSGTV